MRKVIALVVVAGVALAVSGCAVTQSSPVYGGIVTANVKGPVAGVDNSVKPEKTGEATASAIVFFASGDASIATAMKNGSITKVHHVECETFSVLGLYASYKTIVHGE